MHDTRDDSTSAATPTRRRPRLAGAVIRVFAILGISGIGVRLSGCAESLAYYPSREAFVTPPGVEDVRFESADGTRLHGWFIPAADADPAAPGPAILHVHGNAGNISTHESFSSFFARHGFSVFLFDYRGYGRSEEKGPLRRGALLADTEAALAALRARPEVDPERIGVYGVSLGGVFALAAAAGDPGVRAVATVSAFSSWVGIARDLNPLLGPILMRPGLDPADAAARLGDRPYLIVHGLRDEIVSPRHAEVLAEAARDAGVATTVWTDPAGDHNTMIQTNPVARQQLIDFFARGLAPPPGP